RHRPAGQPWRLLASGLGRGHAARRDRLVRHQARTSALPSGRRVIDQPGFACSRSVYALLVRGPVTRLCRIKPRPPSESSNSSLTSGREARAQGTKRPTARESLGGNGAADRFPFPLSRASIAKKKRKSSAGLPSDRYTGRLKLFATRGASLSSRYKQAQEKRLLN